MFTDYCRSDSEGDEEFKEYISKRGYALCSFEEYRSLLTNAGFHVESIEDRSDQLVTCMEKEIARVDESRGNFDESLGSEKVEQLKASWQRKLKFVQTRQHTWGLFVAHK